MKKLLIVALLLVSQAALTFDYDDQPMSWRGTNYVEGSIGSNFAYLGVFGNDVRDTTFVNGFGYHLSWGHFFRDWTAIELGWLQSFFTFEDAKHANALYSAFRFNIPFGDCNQFTFNIKLGLMGIWYREYLIYDKYKDDDKDNDFIGMLLPFTGIGLSYAINEKLDFTVQYQGGVYIVAGAGLLSAGLTYHF